MEAGDLPCQVGGTRDTSPASGHRFLTLTATRNLGRLWLFQAECGPSHHKEDPAGYDQSPSSQASDLSGTPIGPLGALGKPHQQLSPPVVPHTRILRLSIPRHEGLYIQRG